MRIAQGWKDYKIIATGDGYKLEQWKDIVLLRPDPQVIWRAKQDLFAYPNIHAIYHRSEKGGGGWTFKKKLPDFWTVNYNNLQFKVKPNLNIMAHNHLPEFKGRHYLSVQQSQVTLSKVNTKKSTDKPI